MTVAVQSLLFLNKKMDRVGNDVFITVHMNISILTQLKSLKNFFKRKMLFPVTIANSSRTKEVRALHVEGITPLAMKRTKPEKNDHQFLEELNRNKRDVV